LILSREQSLDTLLTITPVERGDSLMLVAEGELDITTSHVLDEALARARGTNARRIIVDLLAVSFIDSTGLHVLIKHSCAGDGRPRIQLTRGSPQVERLFQVSGAADYLPFVT
jgi:anti-anti-sigma factor